MNETVKLFDEQGEVHEYLPLCRRLPAFLEKYPPREGWRLIVSHRSVSELHPALITLYNAALCGGHKPEQMGLPPVNTQEVVFEARLDNPEGETVATASARKPIFQYKDWESGETAARQRLLAALGFGGEIIDADERRDYAAQNLDTSPAPAANPPAPVPRASEPPASPPATSPPATRQRAPESEHGPGTVEMSLPEPPAGSPAPRPAATSGRVAAARRTPPDGISPALRQQIERDCRILEWEVPELTDLEAAKAFRVKVMAEKKRRTAAGRQQAPAEADA